MTRASTLKVVHPETGITTDLPTIDHEPLPLAGKVSPPTYPVDALGKVMGSAAKALAYHIQVPVGMAAQSVLAAISLAVQGHINVQKGGIGVSPVSLYCMTIAGSGERKSSVDGLTMKPVYQYQNNQRTDYERLLAEYTACKDAHDHTYQSIIQGYKKKAKNRAFTPDEQHELSLELTELEKHKPKAPPRPHILMEEPTAEGIYKHYMDALPVAGLFSDEGGSFFSGHGMSDEAKGRSITLLSHLWDGKPITRTRAAAGESGVLAGRRLATHLMVQPVIADRVLADPLMVGQGFLARFLIAHDTPLMGQRLLADRSEAHGPCDDPALLDFWSELRALIESDLPVNENGELEPTTLTITGEAYKAWAEVHDDIERQLTPHGELVTIKEFAAKAAENAARIAALLAYVETRTDPRQDHIKRAAALMQYYLQTMLQRSESVAQNQIEHEAIELRFWLLRNGGNITAAEFKKLPSAYRKAQKARQLLGLLVDYGHAKVKAVSHLKNKPSAWEIIRNERC